MNTRVLVLLSLLVGIGAVLHTIVPPILFGMKPDMLLTMMFLGIMLFPKAQYVLLLSLVTGFVSALTTNFPGGNIANMIDKPITAFLFFGLFIFLRNILENNQQSGKNKLFLFINKKLNNNINSLLAPFLTVIGTIISGTIFLSVGLTIISLSNINFDGGFLALFIGIVLPTALINMILITVIHPITQQILKRSRFATL